MASSKSSGTVLLDILKHRHEKLLSDWWDELKSQSSISIARNGEEELKAQIERFIALIRQSADAQSLSNLNSANWRPLTEYLQEISRSRAQQGFTSEQTATFIFSLKKPFFEAIRLETAHSPEKAVAAMWEVTELIDHLGLLTVAYFQQSREEVIRRQQEELLELSTPVVKLWDGVLALPMIGTLDSARTQIVMESLLQRIVETESELAIIDITGVPTVDTLVAQHLLKTVTAIRLMGADCIISGIRPQIAQTIVHLGVDLQGVTTKSNLADALALALKRTGFTVARNRP
ncbi:STAS domain-containing protein [Telmatocola sphagniphila]|uniref:STAS domain-containing protein n=1 Tax=Telmatocola sphagniphila TaxID=1123043 RepID=A0A8E6EUI5_9BACT|nr:STAS domain-containing protein [Telmatocola sphagniphila]QVL31312.1 STAS domain-containing protein [Telmatocola sphagniphila]